MGDFHFPRRAAGVLAACLVLTSCGGDNGILPLVPKPAKLAFLQGPSSTTLGEMIAPAVQVAIQDSRGNTVANATNTVTLTLVPSGVASARLSGTVTAVAVDGVATFSDLSIDIPSDGYTLVAASGGLTSAVSEPFSMRGPTKLAITAVPPYTTAGVVMSPPVQVAIKDAVGKTVRTATNAVTVSLASNPTGATLLGTTTVNAVNGVATFSDLSVDKGEALYSLNATSGDLTSTTSAIFTITAPPARRFPAIVRLFSSRPTWPSQIESTTACGAASAECRG